MASPFKIPKKKHPSGSDSTDIKMHSPLSRLQNPATQFNGYGNRFSRGGRDRVDPGIALSSSDEKQSTSCKPLFKDVVRTLLGLNSPATGTSSAASHQCQSGRRSSSDCFSNGWRPKRGSDRLLLPDAALEGPSPPQKRKSEVNGLPLLSKSISVHSVDSLAELRVEKHVGSLSLSLLRDGTWSRVRSTGDAAEEKSDSSEPQRNGSYQSSSGQSSEDDLLPLSRTRNKPSADESCRPFSSSCVDPQRRRPLNRTSWLTASNDMTEDVREKERRRWKEFREKKGPNRSSTVRLRLKPRQTQTEPIVLSSEEEEEEEGEGSGGEAKRKSERCSSRTDHPRPGNSGDAQACSSKDEGGAVDERPSFMQLQFSSLHAGLTRVHANGNMTISESCIIIPLKGAWDGEVSVVASQIRGYGVWDGAVAQGGSLLASREGPAPSLLFLWVSDAQANLLSMQIPSSASGLPCSCLLLVLKEQLQDLQVALLASILDMEEYQEGRAASAEWTSPLDFPAGLRLLHDRPAPLDRHLLKLLGCSAETSSRGRSSQRTSDLSSSCLQQLSSRLIQYPVVPCKGRITVTKEDLACLNSGEFLNDVIIDFYLKYLIVEAAEGSVADRSHVFSSFFYKQLSRQRAAAEDDPPCVPDCHVRHQRVKTWTRGVDIFTKDFLFVPVNQESHWFLVVVCFPGLEDVQYEEFQRQMGRPEQAAGKGSAFSLSSQQLPECTQQGCRRTAVLKRPCILVMDSLKLSCHDSVCRLVRDYLQVEWEVRRGTPRVLTSDNMRSSNCRVPLQDNSSDCGLYLLQYVESFLQNPVVHFDLPLRLDNWFPRQHVRRKREDIRKLIMRMHQSQYLIKKTETKTTSH